MNIDINQNLKTSSVNASSTTPTKISKKDDGKFAEELKTLSSKETKETKKAEKTEKDAKNDKKAEDVSEDNDKKNIVNNPDEVISGLKKAVNEIQKLNRPEEKTDGMAKEKTESVYGINNEKFKDDPELTNGINNEFVNNKLELADENKKDNFFVRKTTLKFEEKVEDKDKELIDNNLNIQETKDKPLPQMNANMNFSSNEQSFSEFVNPKNNDGKLKISASELEEEQKILSTIDENIAIANKNMVQIKPVEQKSVEKTQKTDIKQNNILQEIADDTVEAVEPKTKTVTTETGVKKVDKKTNVTVETIVKYDTVIMDKSDVEFFSKLVNEGVVDVKEVQNAEKSSQVSKTLADLIAKSMNENKPVRIDFDNDISIIIKISKSGKISADFLPSSQVAEAYLKENLPVLRQRFDDNNIDYDELNQKQRQQRDSQDNRKKGRKDE